MKEYTKAASIKRVITGRIPKGYDLLSGIKEVCKAHEVKHGYIVGLVGSLKTGRMIYAIPEEGQEIGIRYSDPVNFEGPLEILSTQGTIGTDDQGNLSVHAHILVSDKYMRVFGGHFVDGGNEILATAELVIHELEGVENKREYDDGTGFFLFKAK